MPQTSRYLPIKIRDRAGKHLSYDEMRSNGAKQMRSSSNALLVVGLLFALKISSAAAYFEGCDHTYNINAGYSYLQSPYYPNPYPAGTSCRYRFVAPLDYDITINCTINMPKSTTACSTEYLYIARDGDIYLRDSEQFCGVGTFVRSSVFRSVVIAYTSQAVGGSFQCSLYAKPQPCDCGWSVNTKITNGQETNINEYPSMAGIVRTNDIHPFCSGAIISHYHILTAAHCLLQVDAPAEIVALVGDHNLASATETKYSATYIISQLIRHSGFTTNPMNNDIALLRTSLPIEWSRGVGPICLPPPAYVNTPFSYQLVDLIGWGTTSFAGPVSDTLQKVTVTVADNEACARNYNTTTIYTSQLCTWDYTGSSKDSCQYDSGGPVILKRTRQYLVGCISFGKSCGQGGYAMGVNTRITSYLSWIYSYVGNTICTPSDTIQ